MAETKSKAVERVYTIPLRKETLRAPRWKRTERAVSALRTFLQKHMKSQDVKLGEQLNNEMWKHGIRNPPHKVKVTVTKNAEGVISAELFGAKKATPATEKKK